RLHDTAARWREWKVSLIVGADGRARDDAGTWYGWAGDDCSESTAERLAMRLYRAIFTVRQWMLLVATVALCLWASTIWQRVQITRRRSEFCLQQAAEIARIEESCLDLAREFAGRPPVTKTRQTKIVDALLPDGTVIRLTPYSHHGPCGGVHAVS